MKKHSKIIIQGSIIMFIGFAVKTIIIFARNLLIGNTLGASVLGTFTIANTVFQFLSIFALFGLYNTINKFAPEHRVKKDAVGLQKLMSTSFLYAFVSSGFIIAFTLLGAFIFNDIFSDEHVAPVLRILILGLPFLVGIRLISAITTSFESTKIQAFVENITLPIATTVFLIIFIVLGLEYEAIPLGYLFGNVISFITGLALMKRSTAGSIPIFSKLRSIDTKYLVFAFPIFINALLFYVMSWFDTFALGVYKDSEEVGIYNVTLLIAMTSILILSSVNTIFYPTLSGLISKGNIKEAKYTFKNTVRFVSYLTIPLTVIFIVFAPELLRFFGEEFQISVTLMMILASGTFLATFAGPVNLILYIYNKQSRVSLHSLIAVVANVAINIILIPKIGILGAAIANASAQIIQNYLGVILLYRLKGFSGYSRRVILTLINGIVLGVILWIIKLNVIEDLLEGASLITTGMVIVLTSIIFLAFFYSQILLFRLYNPQDMKILQSIGNRLR